MDDSVLYTFIPSSESDNGHDNDYSQRALEITSGRASWLLAPSYESVSDMVSTINPMSFTRPVDLCRYPTLIWLPLVSRVQLLRHQTS